MIIRSLEEIIGSDRDVSGPGWNSRRLLLASDGMGFSLNDTIVQDGAALTLEVQLRPGRRGIPPENAEHDQGRTLVRHAE